jgi:hypothetical protein
MTVDGQSEECPPFPVFAAAGTALRAFCPPYIGFIRSGSANSGEIGV